MDKAIAHLRSALELGGADVKRIRSDGGFESLRSYPPFETLLREWKEKLEKK